MDFMGGPARFPPDAGKNCRIFSRRTSMFIYKPAISTIYVSTMPDVPSHKSGQKKEGWSMGKTIAVVILLILVVIITAVLTLDVSVSEARDGGDFPYATNYRVALPDGEPVNIGSIRIVVMSYENEVVTDVDGSREKLVVGQERVISPRHARITLLGMPVMESDFQITLIYRGTTGNKDNFDMTVKTSRQVPDFLLNRLIPPNMNARPL